MKHLPAALVAGLVMGCGTLFSFWYVAPSVVGFGYSWSWMFDLAWIGLATVITVAVFYWHERRMRDYVPPTAEEWEEQRRKINQTYS